MKNKVLLAIADGVGDRPCEALGWKTPLQYADTKHLDELARQGSAGIMDLYHAGVPVGTDLGHLILFGYGIEDYPGRGPIEAFGDGVELIGGDVAFRCNFASINEDGIVTDRRAGRIREGTDQLAAALNGMRIGEVQVLFKEATEHRAVLVLRGAGLSAAVTDTDPKKEGLSVKEAAAKDESPEAKYTADILNQVVQKAREILKQHPLNEERVRQGRLPANGILTRGAGRMTAVRKITEELGFKACCVASERTVLGVARIAGFDVKTDAAFTGNIDTNIDKKAEMAVEALENYDLVVLHYKATDLMGHDNDPAGKARAIEQFDQMVGKVMEGIRKKIKAPVIIALAADHSTPCERKEHSGDPVPVVISGRNIRKDRVEAFDEISCAEGGLGRIRGEDFNCILLDYLEATVKRGN